MRFLHILFFMGISLGAFAQSNYNSKEYHVSKSGKVTNPGTKEFPFLTIQSGANIAMPGDIITVHQGVYREEITPPRGGLSNDKRIVYQAAPGENVTIKGSEQIEGWKPETDGVWQVHIPNTFFGNFNPYADEVTGNWFDPRDRKHHTGCVYSNGIRLFEAASKEDVFQNLSSKPSWFAIVDKEKTVIWAYFGDNNPNNTLTEINVRQTVFYPRKPFLNYITVKGFKMYHAAPKWAPPTAEQMGLIGTHWSKGWIIENNEIKYSINAGISLGKYGDEYDNLEATAEAYLNSIDRARKNGWNKQTIGSHIVRNNTISYCEQVGIVGSMGASFSQIIGNHIHHINIQDRFGGAEMAGIKFHAPIDVLIKGNRIHDTFNAIWLDWMAQGTRVSSNLMYHCDYDVYFEVNHGPFVIDNNICLSNKSRHISQGGAYVHNLFACEWGNWSDPRSTPYFKPHSTEKIGDHDMNVGDDRFYNNLFIGNGKEAFHYSENEKKMKLAWSYGLQCYKFRPQLPATGGNVYYFGALPCSNEKALVIDDNPDIEIIEEGDNVYLLITINRKQVIEKNKLITGKLLGKAEVPKAHFEDFDGTALKVDTDYFGNKRNLKNPSSGPFEGIQSGRVKLKVW